MPPDGFEERLTALRPRLHRYCARMMGSSIDGEDAVQETMVKALRAHRAGAKVDNLEAWVLRISRNACLDALRHRSLDQATVLMDQADDAAPTSQDDVIAVSFATFLCLPELQRCAVILKDVLGHSVEEIAQIAECSPAAAKSALQRGRASLRRLAALPADTRLPLASDDARQRMAAFTELFRAGDFDGIRAILAHDVKLDLVNRLNWQGREQIAPYFTRYAQEAKWRFEFGAVEGRLAMLVFDRDAMHRLSHFVLIEWKGDRIARIRDFLFAPYALEAIDWARLECRRPAH